MYMKKSKLITLTVFLVFTIGLATATSPEFEDSTYEPIEPDFNNSMIHVGEIYGDIAYYEYVHINETVEFVRVNGFLRYVDDDGNLIDIEPFDEVTVSVDDYEIEESFEGNITLNTNDLSRPSQDELSREEQIFIDYEFTSFDGDGNELNRDVVFRSFHDSREDSNIFFRAITSALSLFWSLTVEPVITGIEIIISGILSAINFLIDIILEAFYWIIEIILLIIITLFDVILDAISYLLVFIGNTLQFLTMYHTDLAYENTNTGETFSTIEEINGTHVDFLRGDYRIISNRTQVDELDSLLGLEGYTLLTNNRRVTVVQRDLTRINSLFNQNLNETENNNE